MADRRSLIMSAAHGVRRVWWKLRRPLAVGAAGLVVDGDGRVLLVRQSYATRRWTLPGGGVKKGETLADCARRELQEEVGVVAQPDAVELLGLYANFKQGKSDHIAVFVVKEWQREAVNDIEISNAGFFAPDELPDPMSGAVRRRIDEFLGRRPVDTHW